MALEIKNIEGVICLKGAVSSSHITEVVNFLKGLIAIESRVIVNFCDVTANQKSLLREFIKIENNLTDDQEFLFYGATPDDAVQLYKEINNTQNFYSTAA